MDQLDFAIRKIKVIRSNNRERGKRRLDNILSDKPLLRAIVGRIGHFRSNFDILKEDLAAEIESKFHTS